MGNVDETSFTFYLHQRDNWYMHVSAYIHQGYFEKLSSLHGNSNSYRYADNVEVYIYTHIFMCMYVCLVLQNIWCKLSF